MERATADPHGWSDAGPHLPGFLALSHQHYRLPLGPSLVSQPVNWRGRHLIWYLLLFIVSLWLQLGLPAELSRFTPFCLALPIIALARHYGWQGALIATLMNAIALIASQTGTIIPSIYYFRCWRKA